MRKHALKTVPPGLVGLIHVETACELVGCTRETLRKYESDPHHPFPSRKKFGRCSYYSEAAVRRWLAERIGIAA